MRNQTLLKASFTFFLLFLCAWFSLGNRALPAPIPIRLWFEGQEFSLNDTGFLLNEQPIVFSDFRCYLGQFTLLDSAGQTIWTDPVKYHLIDAEDSTTLQLDIPFHFVHAYTLEFQIGIDSATSNSGAIGGDLDPTKGMFWTWNSGYINFKLEGSYPLCPSRKNEFEFHIGGYRNPHQTVQTISLPFKKALQNIDIDIYQFIRDIDLTKEFRVMSPGKRAAELARQSTKMFVDAEK